MSSVVADYAAPVTIQQKQLDVVIPATTGAIVPYIPPVVQQPPARITPSVARITPSVAPAQNTIRETGQPRYKEFGVNTLKTSAELRQSQPQINAGQIRRYNNFGRLEAAFPDNYSSEQYAADLVVDGAILGIYDQLSGANPLGRPLSDRRQRQIDNAFTPEQAVGHEIGRNVGNGLQRATQEANDLLRDLWRNRPQFAIPDIRIPELPEVPKPNLPKIPEFKFPEITFPRIKPPSPQPKPIPKPIPNDLEEFTRETDSRCGDVTFRIAFITYITEFRTITNSDGSTTQEAVQQPGSFDGYVASRKKFLLSRYQQSQNANGTYNLPKPDTSSEVSIVESSGTSGFTISRNDEESRLKFTGRYGIYQAIPEDGIWYFSGSGQLPRYEANYIVVDVPQGFSTGGAIDFIKNTLDSSKFSFVVYDTQTTSNAEGCVIPQPEVLPPPPPPPPKECDCDMSCCPEIDYRLMKRLMIEALQEQKFSIDVPVCKCEFNESTQKWEPKLSDVTLDFFATSREQAMQMAELHKQNAIQAAELCIARNGSNDEPIAAIPLSWQIRHEGKIPQMVIQCAVQAKKDGKVEYGSAMYPITVPHWTGKETNAPTLPAYRKGNYEGILVLADNTKVTINAANEAECTKILNAIKPWIDKDMLKDSYFKGGKLNTNIKVQVVKPMYGRYFSEGQRNGKPDWRVNFP